MAKHSMFVGMDVHKESIGVSIAEEGRIDEVRHYGVIPGDLEAVAKVVRAQRQRFTRGASRIPPRVHAVLGRYMVHRRFRALRSAQRVGLKSE